MLTGCQRAIALQNHSDINLNVLGKMIKVNTTGVVFGVKSPGAIVLPTGTRLSITGNISLTTAMIARNYGGSYTKSYIHPTALLCPLLNPQSHWLIVLLHFFSNKIMKICESFSSSESCNMVHPTFDPPKLTVNTEVTQDEIGKIISKYPTKSYLLDPLLTFLIKKCIDILLPSITKLDNCSLKEGLVPDGFKKAVVTPVIKKARLPDEDLKNYRPVSGLSFISKLVERVVAKQLVDHIHQHGLDNSYQSAYKSMKMALPFIKNYIYLSLSRGEATALVLLNLLRLVLLCLIYKICCLAYLRVLFWVLCYSLFAHLPLVL